MTFKQFVNEHYGKPEPSIDTRDMLKPNKYRHSPSNMKGFIDKMFKSGRQHTKTYQEFKVPVQK